MACVGSPTCLSPTSTSTVTQPLSAQHPSPAPTLSIQAQLQSACLPLSLCLFKHNHSSPSPTVSIQVWMLITHLNQSPNAHFYLTMSNWMQSLVSNLCHLELSLNAHIPPLPCPFKHNHSFSSQIEPKCSLSAFTMAVWAQSLVSHFRHVDLSPSAHLPPPCLIEHNRSSPTFIISKLSPHISTMSIWAQPLVYHPPGSIWAQLLMFHHILSSSIACVPPPPCQFKPEHLSPASTMSIQAWQLISHLSYTIHLTKPTLTLLWCYSHELKHILTQDLLPDLWTCIRVSSCHPPFWLPSVVLRFSSILATNPMNLRHSSAFRTASAQP